jgi:LysR family transcriptional regulator for metE and metH
MTKSAEELCVSQSALSQQLKDIESKLQVDLFYRTRKKMVLTESGRKLLEVAEQVVDVLEEKELELTRMAEGECGELKVGTHCIFCFKWLPTIMAGYREKYPKVELELGTSYDPLLDLEQKKFDIVISAREYPKQSCDQHPLFHDELVCIMQNTHPLAGQQYVRVEDFQNISMISHAEKQDSKLYDLLLGEKGIEPQRYMMVGQPHAIVELVVSGLGVSVFPLWAVKSAVDAGMLAARPICKSGVPLTWSALSLKGNNVPAYRKEFVLMMQRMHIVQEDSRLG